VGNVSCVECTTTQQILNPYAKDKDKI